MSKSGSGGSHISDRAREECRLGWKLAGPAFVIMVLVIFYPILQAIYSSLFKHRLTDPGVQKFVFLENYPIVLHDPLWWQAFGITAFITIVTVVVELALGFLIALTMAKVILGRGLLRTAVLTPYSIITVVSAFSWFYAFATDTGFVDPLLHSLSFGAFPEKFDWFGGLWTSMVPICVSEIWEATPFMSLLLLAGLTQIDSAMEEAAIVDGATWGERMRRVVLPNMKSAIMVTLLFRTLNAFRIFNNTFIMTAGSHDTASLSLVAYNQTISHTEVDLDSAVSVLLFLCVVIIAVTFVRDFRVDLARGRKWADMTRKLTAGQKSWQIVATIVIIVYTIIPLIWIVNLSLKPSADRADDNLWAVHPTSENYELILTGGARDLFLLTLFSSILVALIATLIAVILATFCAYAIARLDFLGKRLILGTVLTVSFFPVISLITPLFGLWHQVRLFDTIPSLILPYLVLTLPLSIWTLPAFFRQTPWEMEQATQVDGASSWEAFRKMIVPLAAPGVFITAIIVFFTVWNDFVFAISLTGDETRTVPVALAFFTGASQFESPTGAICAAGIAMTVSVVVLVLIFQRRVASGLTSGAVKG